MHLIKDENGNLVQHGHEHTPEHSHEHTHADGVTHTHAHTHGDGDHTHSHGDCGSCEGGDCKKETIALLTCNTMNTMQPNLIRWLTIFRKWDLIIRQKRSKKQWLISRREICALDWHLLW